MNVQDFSYLLQHPNKVISKDLTNQLNDVLSAYPFFQAARALHLKGLKNSNSFKYNDALKITAAYTADRDVLFDFITSQDFVQNSIADTISGKAALLVDTEVVLEEVLPNDNDSKTLIEPSDDAPLPRDLKDADAILDPKLFESKKEVEKKLELGQPLPFTKSEKYSFTEWLQLASLKSIDRGIDKNQETKEADIADIHFPIEEDTTKKKKFDLIDKFLEENPKIKPTENAAEVNIKDSIKFDKNELMTETLARVYLEQKKYKNAIQAYKILSLKYPEKSGFFADRIRAVKNLQQENK